MFQQPLKKNRSDSVLTEMTQDIPSDTNDIATDLEEGDVVVTAGVLRFTTRTPCENDNHTKNDKKEPKHKNCVADLDVEDPDIESGSSTAVTTTTTTTTCCTNMEETNDSTKDNLHDDTGELKLPNDKTFPNSCAICLCPYYPDERILWSSNPNCHHAFHSECIVEWLVKMQDGSPCPCCRGEFVDLEPRRGDKKGEGRTSDWSIRSVVRSVQASMRYSSLR
jgi:hypothetical protein